MIWVSIAEDWFGMFDSSSPSYKGSISIGGMSISMASYQADRENSFSASNKDKSLLVEPESYITFVTHSMISCEDICSLVVLKVSFNEIINTSGNLVNDLNIV